MPGTAVSIRAVYATAVTLITLGLACPPQSAAQTPTPTATATPTAGGPCCEIHAGPGCDDAACQDCVCGRDPVCCQHGPIGWDATCAGTQTILCPDECGCSITPPPTPTPGGPCCSARDPEEGGTGCDDDPCEDCVCGIDGACCDNIWDADCVLEARQECASSCPCAPVPTETPTPVPTPGGDCCAIHDGLSCDDAACRACVCAIDDECCTGISWDPTCVDEARIDCAVECPCESIGDCCEPHGGVGCDDAPCKNCVCDLDTACCDPELGWDDDCVSEATVECAASCLCEEAGSCCEEHTETVGCDDRRCQECVCTFDPDCCDPEFGWDGRCADEAATDCHARCAGCGVSDCCDIREGPGCSSDACEACVCDIDDFCCNPDTGVWDGMCVEFAFVNCASTCQCEGPSACPGDCDNNDSVGINELISCVNIALGSAAESTCPACDRAGDGVAINDLIAAVNAAQNGCS